ncbi:argininosuccinate lyase [Amyelois transitella]|uniref:argininosuccinate lyase n=1 Tax=Amyelois transitella TaxID=680683 RepID=UPI00067DABE4|nr:argininosuccinate lyase [Amyelois transitella]
MSDERYQLWGGCFYEEPSDVLRRLNDSLSVDSRLFREDIRGSQGWALELQRNGQLGNEDYLAIKKGLEKVEKELEDELCRNGKLNDTEEDIHSVVERRLHKHVGDAALKLHTARSRNDQSATDTKLWMMTSFQKLSDGLKDLITILLNRAEKEINIITAGYTHLQRAQPIRWSHFLLSHAWTFHYDFIRLKEQYDRLSMCPLGSGALAGCALPIDRIRLAHSLGFQDVTRNSMFAVSSRDHIVEFLNWASLCGIHLSRISEDLIIYSSQEFGIVRLSDKFSTGSSLMPQKRNPDGLELIRGAAALLLGDSIAFNCTLKGLPSTYNKDLQSDKEILFRCYDKLFDCLKVATGTIGTMDVDAEKALAALEPTMLATDLAHLLVRRGIPFRRAHHHVGALLRRAAELGTSLVALPHHEYTSICPEFGEESDVRSVFSWESSVEQYTSTGGTAKSAVEHQISVLRAWLRDYGNIQKQPKMARSSAAFLAALALVFYVASQEYHAPYNNGRMWNKKYIANKENIQQIHSMIDAYKGEIEGQMIIETNEMIDTKYRTWKRNADLINSLLTLPKGMNDAGR